MVILGVTGSIGMGKTTFCAMLRGMGVDVHEADRAVHALLAPMGAAVESVLRAFPDAQAPDGGVDRRALGRIAFADGAALTRLEAIIHPLVHVEEERFLKACYRRRSPLAALEEALLFETGGDKRCNAVLTVSASPLLQTQRVLARPGVTREHLRAVRARQMADAEKRRRSDFVAFTSIGKGRTIRTARRMLYSLIRSSRPYA